MKERKFEIRSLLLLDKKADMDVPRNKVSSDYLQKLRKGERNTIWLSPQNKWAAETISTTTPSISSSSSLSPPSFIPPFCRYASIHAERHCHFSTHFRLDSKGYAGNKSGQLKTRAISLPLCKIVST